MTLPDCDKNQLFAKQFTAVVPPKATFRRIMRQEEQAKFVKEQILALAAKRDGKRRRA